MPQQKSKKKKRKNVLRSFESVKKRKSFGAKMRNSRGLKKSVGLLLTRNSVIWQGSKRRKLSARRTKKKDIRRKKSGLLKLQAKMLK